MLKFNARSVALTACAALALTGSAQASGSATTTVTITGQNGDYSGTVTSPRLHKCADQRTITVYKQKGSRQNPRVDATIAPKRRRSARRRRPAIIAAMADAQATTFVGRTAWARNLATPVRDFLSTETGSAIVLLGATIVALLWSNSPWSDTYESVWTTKLSINIGASGISADLRHWVNEGLMTFFFLVVGLEAKREFDMGELRERRRLAVPVLAAIGGMAVPVAIYLAFNAGGAGAHGWGAAMSTDTAFALGALALLTPARGDAAARVPADARRRRRSRRAARDRDGVHQTPLAYGAARRARAVRAAAGACASRRPGGARPRCSSAWRCGWRCSSRASTR